MSSPASPVPKASKSSRRPRHKHNAAKSKAKRGAKPAANPGLFEVIDDWNHEDVSGWLAPTQPPADPVSFRAWEQQGRVDRLRDLIPFWRDGVIAADAGKDPAKLEDFLRMLEENKCPDSWGSRYRGWGEDYGEDVWPGGDDLWGAPPSGAGQGWDDPPERGWGSVVGDAWVPPAVEVGWGAETQDVAAWGDAQPAAPRPDERHARSSENTPSSPSAAAHLWNGQQEGQPVFLKGEDPFARDPFVEEVARQEEASHEKRLSMHEFYAMPTEAKVKKIQEVVEYLRSHSA